MASTEEVQDVDAPEAGAAALLEHLGAPVPPALTRMNHGRR